MPTDLKSIAQRIRARREYLGLTQGAVAEKISMSGSNYSRIEKAEVNVGAEDLGRIAAVLNVTAGWLYGEEEDLTQDERDLVLYYRGVPEPGKRAISASAKSMHDAYEGLGFDDEGESDEDTTIGKRAE